MEREGVPGPLEGAKRGDTSAPGLAQPEAAEVESARLLANQARERLRAVGLGDERIGRLADDWVARDRGQDLEEFVAWATSAAGDGEPA